MWQHLAGFNICHPDVQLKPLCLQNLYLNFLEINFQTHIKIEKSITNHLPDLIITLCHTFHALFIFSLSSVREF